METIKRGDRVAIVELARDAVYDDGEWRALPDWYMEDCVEQQVFAVGTAIGHHNGAVMVEINKKLFPAAVVEKQCTMCYGHGGWENPIYAFGVLYDNWVECHRCEGSGREPATAPAGEE